MHKALSVRCQRCTKKKIMLRCIVIGACAVKMYKALSVRCQRCTKKKKNKKQITLVNDQKQPRFATDSYRFWDAESRKNSQNVPSRLVFSQNLISYPYKESSENFFLADCSLFSWPKIEVVMVN